jgi:hypothetical protein
MINRNNELRVLTEAQVTTITHGLIIAAERFERNVKEIAEVSLRTIPQETESFLKRRFETQARECREMAGLIGGCEQITLEISEPDPNWCYSCDRPKGDCACEKEVLNG